LERNILECLNLKNSLGYFYKRVFTNEFEMEANEKFNLIKRNTEEIMTEEDLKYLLDSGTKIKHYIGFEISGKIHLGTGLMCMSKVKDFMDAGLFGRLAFLD